MNNKQEINTIKNNNKEDIQKNESSLNNPNNSFLSVQNISSNIKNEFDPNLLNNEKNKNP